MSKCLQNRRRNTNFVGSYDESVNEFNFGKISALQEINFAHEGGYQFYYMGEFYGLRWALASRKL